MACDSVEDYLDLLVDQPSVRADRIAVAIPLSGVLGLTGPAGLAVAQLALEDEAARWDTQHRVTIVPIDAGSVSASTVLRGLVDQGLIGAVVGFHGSDVFGSICQQLAGRIPYVYTPPHEGGPVPPGVFRLGASPADQVQPVVDAFATRRSLRRWGLIGDDYIWPQRVHRVAAQALADAGAEVVLEDLSPVGCCDPEALIDTIKRSRVQALLVTLVGRDLVRFNRAFAASGLEGRVIRVSASLEECGLVESGGDDSGELYTTMSWFASDPQSAALVERFSRRWGSDGPPLGSYAAGLYPAVRAVARLAFQHHLDSDSLAQTLGTAPAHGARVARAEGLDLIACS